VPDSAGTMPKTRRLLVSDIQPSPRNPRRAAKDVGDLADSIGEYGLMQPIVVRSAATGYEIVAGHRRFAAVQELGWSRVPAIIREADDDTAYLLTLIENLQRADLTAREESRALELLVRERGWTTRQVAAGIKRSQAYVSKRLRLFEDPVLGPLVMQNRLVVSVAEELLPATPRQRKTLAERAMREHWDGTTTRAAVRRGSQGAQPRQRGTTTSLLQALRTTRNLLKQTSPEDLEEAQRREMRLLFLDLAMFARAPLEKRELVFPPLPKVSRRSSKTA
jgi:ParB family chromosome partitioning protein